MTRDWLRAFRNASFRGVPFKVDEDGPESGRRVAIHEISGGEVAITEDMGRKHPTIRVSAYVVSDIADVAALAFEAACNIPGPGLLLLPMDLPQMVRCAGCTRNRRKDEAGIIYFDLEFVPVGGAGLSIGGIGALQSIFTSGMSAAAKVLA